MRRAVLLVRAGGLEGALDRLLPRLADGVHARTLPDGIVELAAYPVTQPLPPLSELAELAGGALVGASDEEAPDDWRERRALAGGGVAVGGRLWLRTPLDPPAPDGLRDLVVDRGAEGVFGAGMHPTTALCLGLLLDLPAGGSFVDLGCGAGALAIAAAFQGFTPVEAVDVEPAAVAATLANAELNGAQVRARVVDLASEPPPAADVAAANISSVAVHAALARALGPNVRAVIASGVAQPDAEKLAALYERFGLSVSETRVNTGWAALLLERP